MRSLTPLDSDRRSNAPAFLVSLILHLLLLIAFAVWAIPRQKSPLVVRLSQSADSAANHLDPVVLNQPVELPPVEIQSEVKEPDLAFELAPADFEWNEPPAVSTEFNLAANPSSESRLIGTSNALLVPPPSKSYSQPFQDLIADAQENGIDIVMVFDSTGSMGAEIMAVKSRLMEIGQTIQAKIPAARFSLVTYRDHHEHYLVMGTPLSTDLSKAKMFASRVFAAGGGDEPESVRAGMEWAMRYNDFDRYRQKAMLIFGDARPHANDVNACIRLARDFHSMGKARVSTITCRKYVPIPEFYAIARAGGGDAYLIRDTRRLMLELLVSAFGNQHRQAVVDFFKVENAR